MILHSRRASASEGLARLGRIASIASLLALSAGLLIRAIRIRLWPLASTYDFALGFVWGLILFHLAVERRRASPAGSPRWRR